MNSNEPYRLIKTVFCYAITLLLTEEGQIESVIMVLTYLGLTNVIERAVLPRLHVILFRLAIYYTAQFGYRFLILVWK